MAIPSFATDDTLQIVKLGDDEFARTAIVRVSDVDANTVAQQVLGADS